MSSERQKPNKLVPAYETGTPTNPDTSNINVNAKPNVFAITRTPARPPETTLTERSQTASAPTQEETRAANAGEYAPRGFTKIMLNTAKNHPVRTSLAATAALTAAAYTIPAIHEQVNSSVAGWWNSIGEGVKSEYDSLTNKQSPVFQEVPAGRTPDTAVSQADLTELPSITPYQDSHFNELNAPGISFRLEEKPPVEKPATKVFRNGVEDPSLEKPYIEYFSAFVNIKGYIVAKELSADGSVMLAIEVPKNNNPFTSGDLDKNFTEFDKYLPSNPNPLPTPDNLADNGNEGVIKGIIVWLKIDVKSPFGLSGVWQTSFDKPNAGHPGRVTLDPKEVYRYIMVGDPVMSRGYDPQFSSNDSNSPYGSIDKNLKEKYEDPNAYEQARQKLMDITASNKTTIQRIKEDAKTGNVSIGDQLRQKLYIIEIGELTFVPHN